jgi:hypothetical protein
VEGKERGKVGKWEGGETENEEHFKGKGVARLRDGRQMRRKGSLS